MKIQVVTIGIICQIIAIGFFIATLVSFYNLSITFQFAVDDGRMSVYSVDSLRSAIKWFGISLGSHFIGSLIMWFGHVPRALRTRELPPLVPENPYERPL